MGSPRSHRTITSKFSEITGGAVLAIDYRLMPEHSRMDGIEDCRSSYRWMLDNGPDGLAPSTPCMWQAIRRAATLTLSLIAWVRDQACARPTPQ